MTEVLHLLSLLSAGAAGALFSAVWEGAVLCALVVLCLRLLPGLSAGARSVVWLNVFLLLLLLDLVPAFAGSSAATGSRIHAIRLDLRWSLALAALWVALSLWRATQLILGAIHLRRLASRAVRVSVDAELRIMPGDAPGGRTAELCTTDEVARPSVLGFFRPRILIPTALLENLSPAELHQVVLHEMEHLRRADDWTNLLQKIGLVLFPLNPVLLWVERRLCAERELACDDRVLRSSAGRKAYALCLTRLAQYSLLRRRFSLVLGAWERRPELVRRVHRILREPVRSMSRRPAMLATGGLLAGALGCAVALSHSPQLVNFGPIHEGAQQSAALAPLNQYGLDPHEVGRALGGTPQLVKATMSSQPLQPTSVAMQGKSSVQAAVLKSVQRRRSTPSRIASLAPEPPPLPGLPALDQRTLIVLTEWTTYKVQPRVVMAVSMDQHRGDQDPASMVAVPATYAIVHTPHGWLIIQI